MCKMLLAPVYESCEFDTQCLRDWDDYLLTLASEKNGMKALESSFLFLGFLDPGVGIVVCLTTLVGHMVANCISNYVLCIYLVSILSLLLLQGLVIITIFFKTDWASKITSFVDDHHMKLRAFLMFHLTVCRWIVLMVAVAQINVLMLALIIWAVGLDSSGHDHIPEITGVRHSYLDVSNSTTRLYLLEAYRKVHLDNEVSENVDRMVSSDTQSFISWLKGFLISKHFHRPPSSSP